jgi:adenine phosphoribosyltransferase
VVGTAVLLELSFLPGRERLTGEQLTALVTV